MKININSAIIILFLNLLFGAETLVNRSIALGALIFSLALNSCSQHDSDSELDSFPELEHGEPTGEGMELNPSVSKSLSNTPQIDVSKKWSVKDQKDMRSLIDESIAIMIDPRFSQYASSLKNEYPKVWFAKIPGFADSELVGKYVPTPPVPARYLAATVYPSSGWASTGGAEGKVKIKVSTKLLDRWRSEDVVMRACAINTMSHEISHTMSRDSQRYLFAFTDTGVGKEARRTPPASYLTGNIALCSHLINEGRITRNELKSCVAIWYKPRGFQSKRCNDFPGDTPIK